MHVLDSSYALQRYGFLYLEYKNEVYFWEFVKIYQRILMIKFHLYMLILSTLKYFQRLEMIYQKNLRYPYTMH